MNRFSTLLLACAVWVIPSCGSAKRVASVPSGTEPPTARASPLLLGIEPPIRVDGGHAPFFDRQLRGVHLVDRSGRRFTLEFPASDDEDRTLALTADAPFDMDGRAQLWPDGPAEETLLRAIRDDLRRRGYANPPYAPKWNDGVNWDDVQKAAHPLRHVEMERRLNHDADRSWRRRELHSRLESVGIRLHAPPGGEELSDEETSKLGKEWHEARRALFDFYEDAAAAFGLLGPPAGAGETE